MDIKNRLILVEQIAEHFVEVHLAQDIPLGILHTALVNILSNVAKRINDSAPKPAPDPEVVPAQAPTPDVSEAPVAEEAAPQA